MYSIRQVPSVGALSPQVTHRIFPSSLVLWTLSVLPSYLTSHFPSLMWLAFFYCCFLSRLPTLTNRPLFHFVSPFPQLLCGVPSYLILLCWNLLWVFQTGLIAINFWCSGYWDHFQVKPFLLQVHSRTLYFLLMHLGILTSWVSSHLLSITIFTVISGYLWYWRFLDLRSFLSQVTQLCR